MPHVCALVFSLFAIIVTCHSLNDIFSGCSAVWAAIHGGAIMLSMVCSLTAWAIADEVDR